MLQLSIVPAYALTIHKTQALSIKHIVRGSLEGIFAFGQVYVLISRVTDPANLELIGLPPKDIIEDLSAALLKKFKELGYEKPYAERDAFFKTCIEVSKEWEFDNGNCYAKPICERFSRRHKSERTVPMVHKTLKEVLNPQPIASEVLLRLLKFIDRVDVCSQSGEPRPEFTTEDGSKIFPSAGDPDELWWLTELSRRKYEEGMAKDLLLEDGAGSSSEESDVEVKNSDEETNVSGDCSDCGLDTIQSNDGDDAIHNQVASSSQRIILPTTERGVIDSQCSYS